MLSKEIELKTLIQNTENSGEKMQALTMLASQKEADYSKKEKLLQKEVEDLGEKLKQVWLIDWLTESHVVPFLILFYIHANPARLMKWDTDKRRNVKDRVWM